MGRPFSKEYVAYMASPEWRATRRLVLERAGHRCQFEIDGTPGIDQIPRCHRTTYLQVHHRTYVRLGRELPADLEVLCWPHHQVEHLMQVNCQLCGRPTLGWFDVAEEWLLAELRGQGIEMDVSPMDWKTFPNKTQLCEALANQRPFCESCNVIVR